MALAAKIATTSDCRMKHAAVIVRGRSVLSVGVNKFRNHPQFVKDYEHCSVHAEIDALRKIADAQGADIYVARVNRRGDTLLSRPCNRCYAEIRKAGIRNIYWTD